MVEVRGRWMLLVKGAAIKALGLTNTVGRLGKVNEWGKEIHPLGRSTRYRRVEDALVLKYRNF